MLISINSRHMVRDLLGVDHHRHVMQNQIDANTVKLTAMTYDGTILLELLQPFALESSFAERFLAMSPGRGAKKSRISRPDYRYNAYGCAGRAQGR